MNDHLTHITLTGTMRATAWGAYLGDDTADMEIDFSADYMPPAPDGLHRSPWAKEWFGIRESFMDATSSGDMIGGCGDVIQATIIFHYAGDGRSRQRYVELKPTRATADLFQRLDAIREIQKQKGAGK